MIDWIYRLLEMFQLTRPRGTRRYADRDVFRAIVSTHASAGDATLLADIGHSAEEFQLTRPRGTRPLLSSYASNILRKLR